MGVPGSWLWPWLWPLFPYSLLLAQSEAFSVVLLGSHGSIFAQLPGEKKKSERKTETERAPVLFLPCVGLNNYYWHD